MAVSPPKADDFQAQLDAVLASIQDTYPPLRNQNLRVRRGLTRADGRLLEFFPEWEPYSPSPGSHTIEVYEPGLKGSVLHDSVAGDAMHLLGAVDPRTQAPVDSIFRAMKESFKAAMSPRAMEREQIVYQKLVELGRESRSFEDYFDRSRLDAYIRAGLFPMVNPDWQKPGVFTPDQLGLLERMREYLHTGQEPFKGPGIRPDKMAAGATAALEGLKGAPYYGASGSRVEPNVMSDSIAPRDLWPSGDIAFSEGGGLDRDLDRPFEQATPREMKTDTEVSRIRRRQLDAEPSIVPYGA